MDEDQDASVELTGIPPPYVMMSKYRGSILNSSGYALVLMSVASFGSVVFIQLRQSWSGKLPYLGSSPSWIQILQVETGTISLVLIAIIAALIGKGLLTTAQRSEVRTIPLDDLPLVAKAVVDGKSEPIDQYVRLRSLVGVSGMFTKLGVTGLPLTTVFLTLVFAFISLLPVSEKVSTSFLDLTKLTLGAFIGSFVQRQVELRRQDRDQPTGSQRRPDLSV